MQPPIHLAVSTACGGTLWAVTGEPWSLPIAVASGVVIDVDYLLYRFNVAIKLLHGWEWFVALVAVGLLAGFPWWVTAAAVGYGLHIACDQMSHKHEWWWYIITFRTWKRYRWRERRKIFALNHGDGFTVLSD